MGETDDNIYGELDAAVTPMPRGREPSERLRAFAATLADVPELFPCS